MSEGLRRPFVSVKFSPAGRTYSFLLPDLAFDADDPHPTAAPAAPAAGDALVVETPDGLAVATMTRIPTALSERRQPANDSQNVVVRRATREDILQKLKQDQREQECGAGQVHEHVLRRSRL